MQRQMNKPHQGRTKHPPLQLQPLLLSPFGCAHPHLRAVLPWLLYGCATALCMPMLLLHWHLCPSPKEHSMLPPLCSPPPKLPCLPLNTCNTELGLSFLLSTKPTRLRFLSLQSLLPQLFQPLSFHACTRDETKFQPQWTVCLACMSVDLERCRNLIQLKATSARALLATLRLARMRYEIEMM
ncbi:hypothetical protein B0J13DRAFT_600813 [Dactylonectria estremocensis]|uniref:Uncharacterized protein n=1 Tax=Dactylonectria estremocensis TaxID=1079267 RepID=A0A9P9FH01_9HYPO|nr:hypothetical protein B0J13DRAFT_600813 [Dactylonectria estremocensis]